MKKSPQSYTVGRRAFAKVSAIEGIHLTQEMDRDFRDFEQKGLAPEDRRRAIAEKYAHVR